MLGDLLAEVAAAGVNDEVFIAVVVRVDLDKVIAAAERAYAALEPPRVFELAVAFKALELIELRDSALVYVLAGGDVFAYYAVECVKVEVGVPIFLSRFSVLLTGFSVVLSRRNLTDDFVQPL